MEALPSPLYYIKETATGAFDIFFMLPDVALSAAGGLVRRSRAVGALAELPGCPTCGSGISRHRQRSFGSTFLLFWREALHASCVVRIGLAPRARESHRPLLLSSLACLSACSGLRAHTRFPALR